MSTRAVYTFIDNDHVFHVYKHSDGYPQGAAEFIENSISYSWLKEGKGRFEAADLSAGFVAANKHGAGDVYLTDHYEHHGDLDYRYEISQASKDKAVMIKAFAVNWDEEGKRISYNEIFNGSLLKFREFEGIEDIDD